MSIHRLKGAANSFLVLLWLAASSAFTSGCISDLIADGIRLGRGPRDLNCHPRSVIVDYLGSKRYRAFGCGKSVTYYCPASEDSCQESADESRS
jgi:hypothetical protein